MSKTINYKRLPVALGERSYDVYIGSGLLHKANLLKTFIGAKQVMIVSNATVAKHYLTPVLKQLAGLDCAHILLPDGEEHKNLSSLEAIFAELYQQQHYRNTTLIALGGGVIGDITGFAASCYQRGVDYLQIPTTLLAQVDSAVGGKTAVNYQQSKNLLGAFHQPRAVISDIASLATLPQREFHSGLAEIIKAGLIADADFFNWFCQHVTAIMARDEQALIDAIYRACAIKAEVVGADEKETGLRMILNFGHTFCHALEAITDYKRYLHGEAVAIGMMLAAHLSERCYDLSPSVREQLAHCLTQCQLPTCLPADIDREQLLALMLRDKKNIIKHPRFIVLKACGQALVDDAIDLALVKSVL